MDQNWYIIFYLFFSALYPVDSYSGNRIKRDELDWGYTGSNGPAYWGGKCSSGKKQSPVNILSNNTQEDTFDELSFGEYYNTHLHFEAVSNGHTLAISLSNATKIPTIQGGGLNGKYAFQGLHFHWESEHQIDGERAALEMHLVHYNLKYKDIEIASLKKDGLAVIAVLCDEIEEPDSELEDFIQKSLVNAGEGQKSSSAVHNADEPLNNKLVDDSADEEQYILCKLIDLLPTDVDMWFRYEGSLTTPGCHESVTWTVLFNRVAVSSKTLKSLRKLRDKNGQELTQTYRPIQDINNRIIYFNVGEEENEVGIEDPKLLKNISHFTNPNSVLLVVTSSLVSVMYNTMG